jgi:hypothetical protein
MLLQDEATKSISCRGKSKYLRSSILQEQCYCNNLSGTIQAIKIDWTDKATGKV